MVAACSPSAVSFLGSPPGVTENGSLIIAWPAESGTEYYAVETGGRWEQALPADGANMTIELAVLPGSLEVYELTAGRIVSSENGVSLEELRATYFVANSESPESGWTTRGELLSTLARLRLPRELRCPRLHIEHEERLGDLAHAALELDRSTALISGSGNHLYLVRGGQPAESIRTRTITTGVVQTEAGEFLLMTPTKDVLRLDLESQTTTVAFSTDVVSEHGFRWPSARGSGAQSEIFGIDAAGRFARLAAARSEDLGQFSVSGEQVNQCRTLVVDASEVLAVCITDTRVYRVRDGVVTTAVPGGLPLTDGGLPGVIRAEGEGGRSRIVLVTEGGILLERESNGAWRPFPPSGVSKVTTAVGHGRHFVLGTLGGYVGYFLPEWDLRCPLVQIPSISEVFDLVPHEDGFIVVGRSPRTTAAWAFVRVENRL